MIFFHVLNINSLCQKYQFIYNYIGETRVLL